MISAGARLVIGTIVGFFSGLGLIGLSAKDTQFLTDNIDSVLGGAIALVSLYGFIEHHLQQVKHENDNTTYIDDTKPVPVPTQADSQPVQ